MKCQSLTIAAFMLVGSLSSVAAGIAQEQSSPGTMVISFNKCARATLPEFMETLESAFFPALDALVQDGKLVSYGVLRHGWGDEWNHVIYYQAASIEAFHSAWGEAMEKVRQSDPDYLRKLGSFCSEHKDSIYSVSKIVRPKR